MDSNPTTVLTRYLCACDPGLCASAMTCFTRKEKDSMNTRLALLAMTLVAGSAAARPNGDIIYTDQFTDQVRLYSGGTTTTLWNFGPSNDVRLADVKWGPNGDLYVADGPNPPIPNPSHARMYKISNPLGAASASTLTSGDPLQNPIGIAYHPNSGNFITVNNPGSAPFAQPRADGLVAVHATTGVQTQSYLQPGITGAGFQQGTYIVRESLSVSGNDFLIACDNGGGLQVGIPDASGSTLWRATIDPGTLQASISLVYDFSTAPGGALTRIDCITHVPGTRDYYVTDRQADGVFKVTLDGSGAFQSITQLVVGGFVNEPETIAYNPYTNKLVLDVRNEYDNGGGTPFLAQFNLDGSGYEVLETGVHARGIEFVPAPGTVALLGLGGLVAGRRRRN